MFIDKTKIFVKAGNGGNGAIAFHREKYVAAGGPDGGDGGNGGSIVLRVDDNLSTLMDFRYKRKYTAPNGEDGRGARCKGKRGENLVIKRCRAAQLCATRKRTRSFGICPPLRISSSARVPRRLGQSAFCHTDPPGPALCKGRSPGRGA